MTMPYGTKTRWVVMIAIIAMIPAMISWWMPYHCFKAELTDYVPATLCQKLNDATSHWLEINSFAKAGFHTGYFGREEYVARCSLVHFGWQNFIVFVYGPLASLIGWKPWSSVIWNPVMLCMALFSYLAFTKSQWKQALLTGLFIITFWPLLFFLPTMMTETFHYCLAILAAAGFARILNSQTERNKHAAWITTMLLFIGTIARPSWAPLLLLAIILAMERGSLKSYVMAGFIGFILCLTAYGLFLQMMPDTSTFSASGVMIGGHFSRSVLLYNLLENLNQLLHGESFIILFRIQVGLLLVASLIGVFIMIVRNRSKFKELIQTNPDWIIHSFNFFSVVAITVLFYTIQGWGDYRLISIHLLFSGLLAISRRSALTIPIVLIASNILMTSTFMGEYRYYRGMEFGFDKASLTKFSNEVKPYIKYDPNAGPQDNTLLFGGASNYFPTELIALPAGIGVRIIIFTRNLHFPIQSRYVLFDKYFYNWFPDKSQLRFLTSTRIGNLYYCIHDNNSALLDRTTSKNAYPNPDMLACENVINQKRNEEDPNRIHAFQNLAIKYSEKGKDTISLMYLALVIQMSPNQPDAYYNLSCIFSKERNINDSISYLKMAIERGFNNWKILQTDHDLDNIRNTSYYKELSRNIKD